MGNANTIEQLIKSSGVHRFGGGGDGGALMGFAMRRCRRDAGFGSGYRFGKLGRRCEVLALLLVWMSMEFEVMAC